MTLQFDILYGTFDLSSLKFESNVTSVEIKLWNHHTMLFWC